MICNGKKFCSNVSLRHGKNLWRGEAYPFGAPKLTIFAMQVCLLLERLLLAPVTSAQPRWKSWCWLRSTLISGVMCLSCELRLHQPVPRLSSFSLVACELRVNSSLHSHCKHGHTRDCRVQSQHSQLPPHRNHDTSRLWHYAFI